MCVKVCVCVCVCVTLRVNVSKAIASEVRVCTSVVFCSVRKLVFTIKCLKDKYGNSKKEVPC